MSGTTFDDIRGSMEKAIRALVPGSRRDVPFRIWDDPRDMVETSEHSPSMVRYVSIAHTMGKSEPEVADLHTVETVDTCTVQVVYPIQGMARTLPELERIIDQDFHKIDDAIGMNGVASYVDHHHVTRLESVSQNATQAIALLMIEYSVEYTRKVN